MPLEYHEDGVKILKKRFGKEVSISRLKMVEFPKGATLIPNPVNQIPGFSIGDGHFLPGFPSMAEPMTAWVLDTHYKMGKVKITRALRLPGAREADLVPMMESFIKTHPSINLSSLPKFVEDGTEVLIGLSGAKRHVDKGFDDLIAAVEGMGQRWEEKS